MSSYPDDTATVGEMHAALVRITSKLESADIVGERVNDWEDAKRIIGEDAALLPDEDRDATEDERNLYNSALNYYQAFIDVLSVDGLNKSASDYFKAGDSAIDTLQQHIKDLLKAKDAGDFFSKLVSAVEATFKSLFSGVGIVIGGAIIILLVYLYVNRRK